MFLRATIRIFSITLLFIFMCGLSHAQNTADSLANILATQGEDTSKVKTLNSLAWEYYSTNSDLSLNYAQRALALGKKINFKRGMASAFNTIGIAYYFKGNYPEALKN